jgi:ATP-binding cassette subfamily C protein
MASLSHHFAYHLPGHAGRGPRLFESGRAVRVLREFFRSHPREGGIVLVCLLAAGALSGIGLSTALPVLGVALGEPQAEGYGEQVYRWLTAFGISGSLGSLLVIMIAAFALKGGVLLIANSQVGYAVAQIATELRLDLIRALLEARLPHFGRLPVGEAANSVATEATRAARSYHRAAQMLTHIVEAVVAAGVALAISWKATGFALAAGAVTMAALHRFMRITRRAGSDQTDVLRRILARLTELVSSIRLIKIGALETAIGATLERDANWLNSALRRQVLGKEALKTLQEPVFIILGGIGLWVAVERLATPAAELVLIAVLFMRTVMSIGQAQRKYQGVVANESALWSIIELTRAARLEREVITGTLTPTLELGISFEQVSLHRAERAVLQDLSIDVAAGELTLLSGASGSAAAAVVDLLAGIAQPSAGLIHVDGARLADLDLRAWRSQIGYVPREPVVYRDSLRNNIALADSSISDSEIEASLRRAGAWDFVMEMPHGLDSAVGECAASLSDERLQRIALARALVRRPRLLVLEDATATLDPTSAQALSADVSALRGRVTIVAISGQSELLIEADRFYDLSSETHAVPARPTDADRPHIGRGVRQ